MQTLSKDTHYTHTYVCIYIYVYTHNTYQLLGFVVKIQSIWQIAKNKWSGSLKTVMCNSHKCESNANPKGFFYMPNFQERSIFYKASVEYIHVPVKDFSASSHPTQTPIFCPHFQQLVKLQDTKIRLPPQGMQITNTIFRKSTNLWFSVLKV